MEQGKVPENILKRQVFGRTGVKRNEVFKGAGVGEDCAALCLGPDEVSVFSVDPVTGTTKDIGRLSVIVTSNDIASSGAENVGILVSALLPPGTQEEELKEIMTDLDEACKELNICIMGGHTEVTDAVKTPLLTVTGVGKVKKDRFLATGGGKAGDDLVVTKWVGLEGTSILAKEKEALLSSKFSRSFTEAAKDFERYLSVIGEAAVARELKDTHGMHDITEGGIFGALWEVAESAGCGLTADLKSIPIKQETVEICNAFDINPYELMSSGSMLIVSGNGNELVGALKEKGINAAVIGRLTEGNDRVIINGDEKRFLTPPPLDELYKALHKENII